MDTYLLNPDSFGPLALVVLAGIAAVNLFTFAAFAFDHSRTSAGDQPLPEPLLLSLAALGGWPAAKIAQLALGRRFQSDLFRTLLNFLALPMGAATVLLIYAEVDLWAIEGAAMSYIGEATGTGPQAKN